MASAVLPVLAVANDQFALTASNGDHRVNRFDTGLNGRIHVLTMNHTGAMRSIGRKPVVAMGPLASIGWPSALTTRADQGIPHRNRSDASCAAHDHAFDNPRVFAHDDHAHTILLKTEGRAHHAVGEIEPIPGPAPLANPSTRANSITGLQHLADIADFELRFEAFDLVFVNRR